MKETKLYHTALELSLLDGKDLKAALDERIAKLPAHAKETRASLPLHKALMTAAAVLLVLAATVMAIPSTRAEVLSWLGISGPSEYLSTDPDQRPPIAALDNMIATAKPEDMQITVNDIDRTNSQALNSEGALKVSALLHEDVRITLGDTLFDGSTAYVTLHLGGTAGLPLLDDFTGGSATLVQVDPLRVYDLYEDGPGEDYLTGKLPLYERPVASLVLELSDGTTIGQFVQNISETPAYTAYWDHLLESFDWEHLTFEDADKISKWNRAFLTENEIVSVVEMYVVGDTLKKNTDPDGMVTAAARFIVSVCEDDDLPNTELLNVDLGTVRFNATGYQAMETRPATAGGDPVVWQGDAVVTYMELVDPNDHDTPATDWNTALQMFTNHAVSLDGMTLEALPGAYADDLGIYDLKVRITLPDSVQGDARAAWTGLASMYPIRFNILIDGQQGSGYSEEGFGMIENADGSFTFHITGIRGLDLETIRNVKTITLVPVLRYVVGFEGPNNAYVPLPLDTRTANPRSGDAWMGQKFMTTAYPEYALTFTLG